jgi:hypothetical protein
VELEGSPVRELEAGQGSACEEMEGAGGEWIRERGNKERKKRN